MMTGNKMDSQLLYAYFTPIIRDGVLVSKLSIFDNPENVNKNKICSVFNDIDISNLGDLSKLGNVMAGSKNAFANIIKTKDSEGKSLDLVTVLGNFAKLGANIESSNKTEENKEDVQEDIEDEELLTEVLNEIACE